MCLEFEQILLSPQTVAAASACQIKLPSPVHHYSAHHCKRNEEKNETQLCLLEENPLFMSLVKVNTASQEEPQNHDIETMEFISAYR